MSGTAGATDIVDALIVRLRRARGFVILVIFALLVSAGGVVVAAGGPGDKLHPLYYVPVLGGVIALLGLKGYVGRRLLASRIAGLLANPQRVVWIFKLVYSKNHVVSLYVRVGTEDGTILTLPFWDNEVDQGLAALHARIPHATVGYSDEMHAAFQRDPKSFRRGS